MKSTLVVLVFSALFSNAAAAQHVTQSSTIKTDCPECVVMSTVPAGTYPMGKTIDYGYGDMDGPTHEVMIAKPFAVATGEVTVAEFRHFTQQSGYVSEGVCNVYTTGADWHIDPDKNWENPGFPQAEDHPVVCVSWDDTQAYIDWLNKRTGNFYRLPSEAEWEFIAATGGLSVGEDQYITHNDGNIGQVECCGGATSGNDTWQYTAPVRSFAPDKYKLHDIRGNVWEWQADCHQASYVGAPVDGSARVECDDPKYRVVRGGSYGDAGGYLSPRFRLRGPRTEAYFTTGFRVAHSIDSNRGRITASDAESAIESLAVAQVMMTATNSRDLATFETLLATTHTPQFTFFWGEQVTGPDNLVQWHKEWFEEEGWEVKSMNLLKAIEATDMAYLLFESKFDKSETRKFVILVALVMVREPDGWKIANSQQTMLEGPTD